jgi:hypothetical protein
MKKPKSKTRKKTKKAVDLVEQYDIALNTVLGAIIMFLLFYIVLTS